MRLLLFLIFLVQGLSAWDFSGFVSGELRTFPYSPLDSRQLTHFQPSLVAQPELRWRSKDRRRRFSLVAFGRLDAKDHERTHFDLREAYLSETWDNWDILVGNNVVFWGVTESRHLVNIINTTDALEDVDEEDKMGQPMIKVGWQSRENGYWQFFFMPYFRTVPFAGIKGRIRPLFPVNDDVATFDSSWKKWRPSFAFRWSHVLGDWDLGGALFYGVSREPRLFPSALFFPLIPHYDTIGQLGVDVQYTQDAWLWKLEAIVRAGHGEPFFATTFGFEYTFYQVFETTADIGVLSEFHYDGRHVPDAPLAFFQKDIFFGTRLALNDIPDTQALAGLFIDIDYDDWLFFVEADRRIGKNWRIYLEARFFTAIDLGSSLFAIRRDDFINLRLSRFF